MTPGFSMTWPASVRCTGWLGRICNDLRRLKNKCRNLHFDVDTTAYVMQSLRMTNELQNKMAGMSMNEVAEIAARMCNDMRDEAGDVLAAALAVLETKMSESDFIRFCDKLAA